MSSACNNPDITQEEFVRNGCSYVDIIPTFAFRPSGDELQENLIRVCDQSRPMCEDNLFDRCSRITREEAMQSTVLTRICGCFMNRNEYNVARECDPICSTDGIRRITTCSANICVINGLDIDIVDSTTGDLNVSQQCGGCTVSSGCICVMDNIDVTVKNSRIGQVNLVQDCAYATCMTSDGKEVDCENFFSTMSPENGNRSYDEKRTMFLQIMIPITWISLLVILVLASIYVFTA